MLKRNEGYAGEDNGVWQWSIAPARPEFQELTGKAQEAKRGKIKFLCTSFRVNRPCQQDTRLSALEQWENTLWLSHLVYASSGTAALENWSRPVDLHTCQASFTCLIFYCHIFPSSPYYLRNSHTCVWLCVCHFFFCCQGPCLPYSYFQPPAWYTSSSQGIIC